jgi:hypothetical protein
MKDRVVQYPNRYKLTPVSGDIYDLTPEPGVVTEPGAPINKATMLSDATAAAVAAATGVPLGSDPTVSGAISALAGVDRLWQKIRDIPDVSAAGSISLSLTDVDWSVYAQIKLVGEVSCSGADQSISARLNNIATDAYKNTYLGNGATSIDTTPTGAIRAMRANTANAKLPFDFTLIYSQGLGTVAIIGFSQYRINHYFGISSIVASDVSTFDFACSGYTVALSNVSLWGIKK